MPKSKVHWLAKNNRIENNDICAIVCTENNNIVSYILVIPDIIQLTDGSQHKVNWLHEWWVTPSYQGSIVASFVFNKALKILKNNLLIESNATNAEAFFKPQFNTIYQKTRHTIFLRLNKDILANKLSFAKYLGLVIDLANGSAVKLLNYFNYKKTQKKLGPVYYEYLNTLDNDTWNFIEPICKNDFSLKSKDYINWLIDNAQFQQTPIVQRFPFKFSTTGFSNNIHNHSFKIVKDQEIIGFVSYLFNMIEFNVRCFMVKDPAHYSTVVAALMEHALKSGASYIITDNEALSKTINQTYKPLFTYKQSKTAKAHKRMALNFEGITLTDHDGRFH